MSHPQLNRFGDKHQLMLNYLSDQLTNFYHAYECTFICVNVDGIFNKGMLQPQMCRLIYETII